MSMLLVQFLVKTYRCFVLYVLAEVPVVLVSVFYIHVVGVWSSSDHHAIPKALNNITPAIYHPVTQI